MTATSLTDQINEAIERGAAPADEGITATGVARLGQLTADDDW